MVQTRLTLFVDGASRGNPGRAAFGVVLYNDSGTLLKRAGLPIGITTNNIAEYFALLYGLTEVLLYLSKHRLAPEDVVLTVYSDSELMINQVDGHYQVKNEDLKRLHLMVQHIWQNLPHATITKVSRKENHEADLLANEALEKQGKEQKV